MSARQLGILRAVAVDGAAIPIGRPAVQPVAARPQAGPMHNEPQPKQRDGYAEGFAQGRESGWREGHAKGFAVGHGEGLERATEEIAREAQASRDDMQNQLSQHREHLQRMATELVQARAAVLSQAEDDLVALALDLARKVLGSAFATEEGIRAQARQLLGGCSGAVRVRVRPDLAAELERAPADGLTWIADRDVDAGVIVERGQTRIDGRLQTLVANFADLLGSCRLDGDGTKSIAEEPA